MPSNEGKYEGTPSTALEESWPTVYEIASEIGEIDLNNTARGRKASSRPVTTGLNPRPFPMKEGLYEVTPEQVASLKVPIVSVGDVVTGFQRDARESKSHARSIARAMLQGKEFPPVLVSIFTDDNGEDYAIVSDGQHRSVGAIIARQSVEVVVKRRDQKAAQALYSDQTKSKRIRHDETLLIGNSPLEIYIQDALTSDDHAWSDMIADKGKDHRRMSPVTAATAIGAYVYDTMSGGVNLYTRRSEKDGFDTEKGDHLAKLIKAFGNKQTNPDAFRSRSIKAITYAAIYIFERNDNVKDTDVQRWLDWMPRFSFREYAHLWNNDQQLAQALVAHWNKRLPADRKVQPVVYR